MIVIVHSLSLRLAVSSHLWAWPPAGASQAECQGGEISLTPFHLFFKEDNAGVPRHL
jgi:hypothetical protein